MKLSHGQRLGGLLITLLAVMPVANKIMLAAYNENGTVFVLPLALVSIALFVVFAVILKPSPRTRRLNANRSHQRWDRAI